MRKTLLATLYSTTALVAVGALAGAAQAQDVMLPMKAGVGGYYNFALVSTNTDGVTNNRGHGFQQNIEMEFQGETMLDNGLTAGVRIRLNGNNPGSNIDETELYFKGAFGGLHMGMVESAGYQTQSWAPGGGPVGSVKSSWFGGGAGYWGDVGYMAEDAPKIVYFSPNFNGISLAASYAPENSEFSYAGSNDDDGGVSQQIALSLSYSVDIMGGSVSANVSRESYTTESTAGVDCSAGCGPTAMRYGATISFDDFSLGANVLDRVDLADGGNDITATVVGIGWSQGPLSLGVQHGSTEGSTEEAGANKATITAFNAGYNLGPGINVGARIATGENKGADYTQLVLATFFNF
jgi:outer membrane protein OmpU